SVQFSDVLAVSGKEGEIARPQSQARVVGQVVEEGRADKILVFHYKRKKQYKKLRGHRQPFTAVRITEIAFDGQSFTSPELPKKERFEFATVGIQGLWWSGCARRDDHRTAAWNASEAGAERGAGQG